MKEAFYFSHDSNARHDPKILSMRSVYGSEGYGWYWIIIEMLREQEDYKIEITKYVWNALAMQMQCDADAAKKFVEDCINEFQLLVSDGKYFWSESLLRRMKTMNEKSEKAKKAAEARWKKRNNDKDLSDSDVSEEVSNADAMQTHSECNAIKENKEKEIKRKEKLINNTCRKSKIYDEDSVYYQLANRLYQNILKNNPNHKKPDLQAWANDVRLMMERDNRTEEQIEFLIDWVQNHDFWHKNILSISALRKQFDRLVLEVKADRKKVVSFPQRQKLQSIPIAYQSLQDWAEEEPT